jgi:hypothetical protein
VYQHVDPHEYHVILFRLQGTVVHNLEAEKLPDRMRAAVSEAWLIFSRASIINPPKPECVTR